jgi:hypothetical protein
MNARQAAKAAAKRIEELEYYNTLCKVDIQAYNAVIEGTVDGKSICEWCEDRDECEKPEKGGKGCHDWMLMFNKQQEDDDDAETDGNASDGADDILTGLGPCGK